MRACDLVTLSREEWQDLQRRAEQFNAGIQQFVNGGTPWQSMEADSGDEMTSLPKITLCVDITRLREELEQAHETINQADFIEAFRAWEQERHTLFLPEQGTAMSIRRNPEATIRELRLLVDTLEEGERIRDDTIADLRDVLSAIPPCACTHLPFEGIHCCLQHAREWIEAAKTAMAVQTSDTWVPLPRSTYFEGGE